jgi:hypothetical protein
MFSIGYHILIACKTIIIFRLNACFLIKKTALTMQYKTQDTLLVWRTTI